MTTFHPLISTDHVQQQLDDPDVRLLEVDVDTSAYGEGHIPGAVAWNWQTQLQHPRRRDIVSRTDFERLLGRSGIDRATTVILYGDNHNWFAAHAFWLLRYYGHERIRLMDGGKQKWIGESRPITVEVPDVSPRKYSITKENVHIRALQMDIFKHLDNPLGVLVDVRNPEEFAGLVIAPPGMNETAQRGGHIPGAANIPWSEVLRSDGTFRSTTSIARLYESHGVHASDDVITYCRIGERSSHSWFVLSELLGYENVRNYDGSWTEWGNLIGAPIDVGFPADTRTTRTAEEMAAD